jgi:hypothetical protein
MIIGQDENQEMKNENSESVKNVDETILSMFVISSNPYLITLKFKDKVGGREVYTLIDSGNTNNFVNPSISGSM